MKKNNTIEVLRFIFTMYVVVCHFYTAFAWVYRRPGNGWFAVEFFFVLSGYLLMHSCARYEGDGATPPWQQAWTVLKGKYLRMLPVWFTACCVYFAGEVLSGAYPLRTLPKTFAESFPVFLMLVEPDTFASFAIYYSWYVPAMLIAFAALLPLICAGRRRFTHCIAPLIVFCGLGYLWHTHGTIMVLEQSWVGVTWVRTVRALAEISLGCIAYEVSQWLRSRCAARVNRQGRLLFTALGLAGVGIPLYWMTFRLPKELQLPGLMLMAAGVAVIFSGAGLFERMFRGRFWGWLGQISFALYLGQGVPYIMIDHLYGQLPDKVFFWLFIAAAVVSGLAIHYAAILLVRLWRMLRGWFLRAFFQPEAET